MVGVHDIARDRGWEFLHLRPAPARASTASTAGWGTTEVGRLPGAIRVAPGDDRDEIIMACRL